MKDLPQEVRNVKDAVRVAEEMSEVSTLMWRSSINAAIGLMLPGEQIYFIAWGVDCTAEGKGGTKKTGVIFFSNKRFLFTAGRWAPALEFPLEDILTVAAQESRGGFFDGGGISFRTADLNVSLKFTFTTKINRVREMIIQIAANAAGEKSNAPLSQVCECPGCGASVIIHANIVNKCEYCDRYVEKRATPAPADAAPASMADELKKYKDLKLMGAISDEEFEAVKEKLLSRV